ncbi:MAG: hypothetical protein KY476_10300 [Planctomycetes bacterium]|nr:hypothetical protein [Planctomycetota bacterium]
MPAKPGGRSPGRRASVQHNLEKPPLTTGRTDDETATLRGHAARRKWDVRHWSVPALILAAVVLGIGLFVLLEVSGVRLISPLFDGLVE